MGGDRDIERHEAELVTILLPNGDVLKASGINTSGTVLATAETCGTSCYDLGANWGAVGSLATARHLASVALLFNGKVLVAGGLSSSTTGVLSSAELYNPETGTWSTTGSMSTARAVHPSVLLPNGKVLVAGGVTELGSGSVVQTAELYDPSTGTWSTVGSLSTARTVIRRASVVMPTGQVVITGGRSSTTIGSSSTGTLSSAELFSFTIP